MNCFARLNAARIAFHEAEMLVSEKQLMLGFHEAAFARFAKAEIALQKLIDDATDDQDSELMLHWASELEDSLMAYQLQTIRPTDGKPYWG